MSTHTLTMVDSVTGATLLTVALPFSSGFSLLSHRSVVASMEAAYRVNYHIVGGSLSRSWDETTTRAHDNNQRFTITTEMEFSVNRQGLTEGRPEVWSEDETSVHTFTITIEDDWRE